MSATGTFAASARRARIAAVPALLLVAIALWEVVAAQRARRARPRRRRVGRARQSSCAHGYRPGDLIVFAPDWIDPVGRLHLGDLIPIDMAARMDAARYGRIWELSIRGARSPRHRGPRAGRDRRRRRRHGAPLRARAGDGARRSCASCCRRRRSRARRAAARSSSRRSASRRTAASRSCRGPARRCASRSRSCPLGTSSSATSGSPTCSRGATIRAPGRLAVEIGGPRRRRRPPPASTTAGCASPRDDARARRRHVRRAAPTAPSRQICFAAEVAPSERRSPRRPRTAARDRLAARARRRSCSSWRNQQRGRHRARRGRLHAATARSYADWWIGLVTFEHGVVEGEHHAHVRRPGRDRQQPRAPAADEDAVRALAPAPARQLGVVDELTAYRLPIALLHGVLVLLVFLDGARAVGPRRGGHRRAAA